MNGTAQTQEVESRLRITHKPVTSRPMGSGAGDEEARTFYVCGYCRIIIGYTPLMSLRPEDVVRCPNCGMNNEL